MAAEPFQTTSGHEVETTVSGGAAEREGDESLPAPLEEVSRKLLLAKQGRRNRIVT